MENKQLYESLTENLKTQLEAGIQKVSKIELVLIRVNEECRICLQATIYSKDHQKLAKLDNIIDEATLVQERINVQISKIQNILAKLKHIKSEEMSLYMKDLSKKWPKL
jgi:hypothetical protein